MEGLAAGEHVEHPEAEEGHDDHAALHAEPRRRLPPRAGRRFRVNRRARAKRRLYRNLRLPHRAPPRQQPARPPVRRVPRRRCRRRLPVPRPRHARAGHPTDARRGSYPNCGPDDAAPFSAPKPVRPRRPFPPAPPNRLRPWSEPVAEVSTFGIVAGEPATEEYLGAAAEEESIEVQHEHQAEAMENVVEDDDSVIVPAPPMEALGHQHLEYARPHVRVPTFKSMSIRRTLIPVLLTSGVMISLFGIVKFVVPEEAALSMLPPWMCLIAICMGLALASLGVLNMLLVRQQLISQQNATDANVKK